MNIQPIEYRNQRILTTAQLAEAYGTDEKRISENFNRNEGRYTEGKHFYSLSGESLKAFKEGYPQIAESLKFTSILYLWTEKGAWHHAKSLNTDRAWEAYEKLVDDYYQIKSSQPVSPTEALLQTVQLLVAQEKRLVAVEETLTTVNHRVDSLDATNIDGTPQQRLNSMVKKYAYDNGIIYAKGWENFRTAFNNAYHTNLEARRLNYMAQHNLKRLSMPGYLTAAGLIEDALRVADKMLNRQQAM
jgi:hypothetical protein